MAYNQNLEKDLLVTLMYSDVFDMPMSAFEVWKYRMDASHLGGAGVQGKKENVSLFAVVEALADLTQKGLVVRTSGMFTLAGREYLVEDRMSRMKRSDRKWKAFMRTARLMRFAPFVRMVAVTGRLATKQIGRESDWDVLIVMESGHIWMGRLLLTLFLHLLGKRRYSKYTKDRICLNHFLTTQSLEVSLKDLFAGREYAYIFPVFGEKVFREFEKENKWIGSVLPNWQAQKAFPLRMLSDTSWTLRVRGFLEGAFRSGVLEDWARKMQKKKIESNPKTHLPGAYIIADDTALIFLPKPQGPRVFEKFMKRLSGLTRTHTD